MKSGNSGSMLTNTGAVGNRGQVYQNDLMSPKTAQKVTSGQVMTAWGDNPPNKGGQVNIPGNN